MRAFEQLGMFQALRFALHPGGDPEIEQRHRAALGVDQDVSGIDVLVDDAVPMETGHRLSQRHRDLEEPRHGEWAMRDDLAQRATAPVLQHQRQTVAHRLQGVGPRHPRHREALQYLEFPAETRGLRRRRELRGQHLDDDPGAVRSRRARNTCRLRPRWSDSSPW